MKTLSRIRKASLCTRRHLLAGMTFIALLPALQAEEAPVAKIQETLRAQSFYFGDVNGQMDDATRAGLRRYQIRNGLPATGIADPATVSAMTGAPSASASAPPKAGQNDRAFLDQVEKDDKRLTGKTTALPPTPAPPAAASAPSSSDDHIAPPTQTQTAERSAEKQPTRQASIDTQNVPQKEEPVADGVLDSRGVAIQNFQNRPPQRRESDSAVVETPVPSPTVPEPSQHPKRPIESPTGRVAETRKQKETPPEHRGGFRKEGEELGAVAEGPTESTGARVFSNRESQPSAPKDADSQTTGLGKPLPKGATVTTTTTQYTDANGWVHTIKKTTVTVPKPKFKIFGSDEQ